MTVHTICEDKITGGYGIEFHNTGETQLFVLSLAGHVNAASVDVLYKPDASYWSIAGKLNDEQPVKVILMPTDSKVNINVTSPTAYTTITVKVSG